MKKLEDYVSLVKFEIQKQLEYLDVLELPTLQEIKGLNIHDEVLMRNPKEIREKYDLPKDGEQIIYVMSIDGFEGVNDKFLSIMEQIGLLKEKYKNEKTQITTINQANLKFYKNSNVESVIMYVGTSSSFASRVKTHSGNGSKGTATVFFKHWPLSENSGLIFKFRYYNFGSEIAPETLKFFEYYLSKDLKPLIGHNRRS